MKLNLKDLIEVSTLQKIQDAFSAMTGMAALITDADGEPITQGSAFTEYCRDYARISEVGRERCMQCDRYGTETAIETGQAIIYDCHSGLIDFSAPIVANGEVVGCIVGGQVLTEALTEDKIRRIAEELQLDYESCYKALQKVPVLSRERIEHEADFLHTISGIVSDMAYSKYMAYQAREDLERTSNMKSDFLASMSHEIRTPMNAVLGMTEMALREELPPAARNYILQIRSSGRILLNIINDILDFSKIESGKMEIVPVEYEMLSLCNDISGIIETRLKDKRVELLISINPDLPCRLYGDSVRVKQILINLANNAVKFTQKGTIHIYVDYEILDADHICMQIKVQDTGCGIKEEDLGKIFDSFQQVDSRRNRGAEGTGLGLAICRKFLDLMHGEISVASEYEKGSTFTVRLPQEVVDWTPSIQVKEVQESVVALGYFQNRFLAKQFFAEMRRLRVLTIAMISPDRIDWGLKAYEKECKGKKLILFTEERDVDEDLRKIPERYPELTVVEMVGFFSDKKTQSDQWHIMRRPLSTNAIAMALNGREMMVNSEDTELEEIDFTAPEAKVLVVDDNAINLTVTEGLLEPLKMKVYSITSGVEAIDLISEHRFDLIFMDHMMPDMDGIQTTRVIRRFHPQYQNVPIIALTANAVEGMKEVFLSEGMNDFVAKPIEVGTLIRKVKKWLPPEKVIKKRKVVESGYEAGQSPVGVIQEEPVEEDRDIRIADLDTVSACRLLGSEKLFRKVLKEYHKSIPQKAKLIGQLKQQGDIPAYTIEVHALKSASRQIGANRLADLAAQLEKAGNQNNLELIQDMTDEMLQIYTDYIETLRPFCEDAAEVVKVDAKRTVSREELFRLFDEMQEAIEDLDMDGMEAVIGKLQQCAFEPAGRELYEQLCEAVDNVDVDTCTELLERWKADCDEAES